MPLTDLLHEEYEVDGDLVIFRCTECGFTSLSLGGLHGHIERHRGYTRLNIQVPFTKTAMANMDELMQRTEVLRVRQTESISLEEVEGL
jgi:hypothetical protein